MTRTLVALGANLGERARTFEGALAALSREVGPLLARSRWIETEPLLPPGADPTRHPPYLNGVVLLETDLAPEAVLARLLSIERRFGRDRTREGGRWMPRTLDLDLLAMEDLVRPFPDPVLPHPRLHERRFVLEPLVEVWPDWRHPLLGRTARELLAELEARERAR